MTVLIKSASAPVLFGTDPEAFVTYIKDGTTFALPPYFLRTYRGVPASNDPRHPVFHQGDGWMLHEDGAAFEMSIRPSHNPRDLFDRIQECAEYAAGMLKDFSDDCLPVLQFLPTVGWDVARWAKESDDFFMSTRFGCDPDNDADDTMRDCAVIDASKHPHRYAGGHIHFSGSAQIREEYILAVQCQKLTTGCAAIAFSDVPELDRERTYLYGKPAKYRLQNYGKDNKFGPEYAIGFEYRTPSARWASSWDIAKEVFKWGEIGIKNLLETSLGLELVKELSTVATEAILTANQKLAHQVLARVESRL